ncbi:cobyrinate a,c-diamide synthase [Methylovirgula sp. 4M-Z18]|uniref:cobyrinate a,c-diamide synthase n=1 Tax=Methylovirgula sp. 4M-Z18 TaxID=2293567 RepID=UPI000E2EE850|nr:cobyrinate a,c-diamide synthase [Methylovirgula sp. 4M-Z18]RFB76289.1 cobyrinate a,c-diamide synthase [Methylovirgula sp. 4M-Z18]
MTTSAKGLVIGAPRSGSGKTTVTLGLLRALNRRGLRAQGLKCGPDYIDPAFHTVASGRDSINLDAWSMTPEMVASLAAGTLQDTDVALCEASMGLFDGVPAPQGRSGASADVAAALGWPVLLVMDVSGQSQTAAAIVKGCATYDPRVRVAGVVINKVASPRHHLLVVNAIEALGIPVLGALPRQEAITLPERHLGLVQARETNDLDARLDAMADFVAAHVDLDRILAIAVPFAAAPAPTPVLPPPAQRIALAQDAAFSFFYPHLAREWHSAGAELIPFSPLNDEAPAPDSDLCWLPGGYPELHAGRLAAAQNFLNGLRRFAQAKPVHGECGGYMTLGTMLTDANGETHRMAGLLSVSTSFAKRKMNLGYREAETCAASPLGPKATRLRGHEFHYATITDPGNDTPFAMTRDVYGGAATPAGSQRGLVSGSFFHVIARAD